MCLLVDSRLQLRVGDHELDQPIRVMGLELATSLILSSSSSLARVPQLRPLVEATSYLVTKLCDARFY